MRAFGVRGDVEPTAPTVMQGSRGGKVDVYWDPLSFIRNLKME